MVTIGTQRLGPVGLLTRPARLVARVPPLVWAVLASRLLIMITGVLASTLSRRTWGWWVFDPTHLSSSLGSLGNALGATVVRWDALHYLSVAEHGYKPAGDTQFFPLYPLLIRTLGLILRSDLAAAIVISVTAFAVALVLLYSVTRDELGERAANATVLLLAFAPLSFFLTAIYTESLLLALSLATFRLARGVHFAAACVAASFAALTHGEGILLIVPLAYMYWERRGRPRNLRVLVSREGLALFLPLAAFLSVFAYQHAIGFGWLAPITSSRSIGHARMMVVSSQNTSSYGGAFTLPFVTSWHALSAGASGLGQLVHGTDPILGALQGPFSPGFQNLVYLLILLITASTLLLSWRRLPAPYAIYATLVVCLFAARDTNFVPLLSFDRYMLPVFPLWMCAGAWVQEHRLTHRAVQFSMLCLVFYAMEFARWVPVA